MFNPLSLLPTSVTSTATAYGEAALDRGLLPDPLVRQAIRILCSQRLAEIASASLSEAAEAKWAFVEDLKRQPLAIETETANEQHYEVRAPSFLFPFPIGTLCWTGGEKGRNERRASEADARGLVQVATEFIQSCLGPNMKYSCALYPTGKETLEQAEVLMLESYCVKAKLLDGMSVLDLGCGWGSLTLFLAKVQPPPGLFHFLERRR